MTSLSNRLLDALATTLAPEEREVFLGDMKELKINDRQAIASLTGLILRRQLQSWNQWQAWLVSIGLILPIGLLLSTISEELSGGNSVYLWMYTNNWTASYLVSGYFWWELVPQIGAICLSWLILASWSWTAGFTIAVVSRVTTWTNLIIAALVLVATTTLAIYGLTLSMQFTHNSGNDPVFASPFYRVIFPVLLQALLVFLPFAYGTHAKRIMAELPSVLKLGLWTSIAVTVLSLLGNNFVRSQSHSLFGGSFTPVPMPFALAGPSAFFILIASRHYWSRKPTPLTYYFSSLR